MKLKPILIVLALLASILVLPTTILAQTKKPNILVIWGDDIGIANVSAYSDGLMGYETPNIDRIGKEGIRFLQYYGEQSCTAGRSAPYDQSQAEARTRIPDAPGRTGGREEGKGQ
jgi:arylsulfatase